MGGAGCGAIAPAGTAPSLHPFLRHPKTSHAPLLSLLLRLRLRLPLLAGDHTVIAKETARMLGMGTCIADASGLPSLDADGKVPKDLGKKYGQM